MQDADVLSYCRSLVAKAAAERDATQGAFVIRNGDGLLYFAPLAAEPVECAPLARTRAARHGGDRPHPPADESRAVEARRGDGAKDGCPRVHPHASADREDQRRYDGGREEREVVRHSDPMHPTVGAPCEVSEP